jgi:hypothetical protein
VLLNFQLILNKNSAVLQPNIQWSQTFHLKFISLYPLNSNFISMEHDGIRNSLPHILKRHSIETSIEYVDKLKTKQSDTPIWHSHTYILHHVICCTIFENSKKKHIYISKYVVNDYTFKKLRSTHTIVCCRTSKVKVLIVMKCST